MIDPSPDTDPSALSPYGGSDGGDHNHDYSGSSAAKERARGVPSSDRGRGREGERGAISVLNCILDFSLSAIKSVERRGRRGRARVDVQLCHGGGGGIGKRKQCLARSATLFTAQTLLSSSFEGMRGECGAGSFSRPHSMFIEPDLE